MNAAVLSLVLECIPDKAEGVMPLDAWMNYVDQLEARIASGIETKGLIDCHVKHRFTPGLYMRECALPAGMIGISQIHNTTHPFVILEGKIRVRTHLGIRTLEAPFFGITEPMTRRILSAITDTRWITFHVTDLTDPEEIQKSILYPHVNPLLSEFQLLKIREKVSHSNLLK